jgi:ElaB/YqjD/DUF883 family membrane-anchored ribosome-binding protein
MKRTNSNSRTAAVQDESLEDVGTHIREIGSILKHTVEQKLDQMRDGAIHARDLSSEKVDEVRDNVVGYVKKKPLQSVMIALGAGAVLGLLLRRR